MKVNQLIYSMLRTAAQSCTLLTYTEVGNAIGLNMDNPDHRNEISVLLDEISLHEHAAGRPLLSVVVTRKDLSRPGNGFYEIAKRAGFYKGSDDSGAGVSLRQSARCD
jgi:hypothetical protein